MEINGRTLSQELLAKIIKLVKAKKELSTIDESVIRKEIKRILSKDSKLIDKVLTEKKAPLGQLMKLVRSELRRLYGSYNDDSLMRNKIFLDYKVEAEDDLLEEMMATHQSTKERLPFYSSLYKQMFKITGKPNSIIDLGCGMNPLSVKYMGLDTKIEYLASDISEKDLDILQFYFDNDELVSGTTMIIDLLEHKTKDVFYDIDNCKTFDIAFFFKVLEIVEQSKSHKISEKLIIDVPAKWVVVSFPTRTISGRKMNHPRRGWIERMLERLEFKFKVIEIENEIFYLIRKFV